MKTKSILLSLCCALVTIASHGQAFNAQISAAAPKGSRFISVPLTTGSTVVATNTSTKFTTATFYSYATISRTAAPVANTNTTYIGFSDAEHTVTNLVDSIAAGSWITIKAPAGTKYDLREIYFNGSTGEKVQIVYEQ